MDERLLTVKQVAELFQVPRSWIYDRTRKEGPERIPHYKLGAHLRFREAEVLEFINEHSRGTRS